MRCNCFPRSQTGCPEDRTRLQRLHGGVNDLMAGHCATSRCCGRRRVGCAVCRLRLAVAQAGLHGTAMMPSVLVMGLMGLMLGDRAMVASGTCALHTSRTPSRARQDEREHREQNQYGAGAAAHAGKMTWRSSRIARPLKSATRAPPAGRKSRWVATSVGPRSRVPRQMSVSPPLTRGVTAAIGRDPSSMWRYAGPRRRRPEGTRPLFAETRTVPARQRVQGGSSRSVARLAQGL